MTKIQFHKNRLEIMVVLGKWLVSEILIEKYFLTGQFHITSESAMLP